MRFRPLTAADATGPYLDWINNPNVRRYLATRFDHLGSRELEEYIRRVNDSPNEVMFAVCRAGDGSHIGNVKLYNINADHGSASLGLVIGDEAYRGKGFGTETIALMTEFAFGRLGLRRISAGGMADNPASRHAFLKCGYIDEGVSRRLYLVDGVEQDCWRCGILTTDPSIWAEILGRETAGCCA